MGDVVDGVGAGASDGSQNTGAETGQGGAPSQGLPPELVEALKHKLSQQDHEIRSLKGQASEFQRIKEAFAPSEPKPKGKWIDPILQHAIEAEKQGRPMPITTEVAVEVQRLNELLEEQERRNKQMEEQIKRLSDPQAWQDQQMFARMDSELQRIVNKLYPEGENRPQYDAIVNTVSGHLRTLQQDPAVWNQFRNSPEAQQRLLHYSAQRFVPTTVRQQLKEEYDRTSPLKAREIQEGWQAAISAKTPDERHRQTEKIRQHLFGLSAMKALKQGQR